MLIKYKWENMRISEINPNSISQEPSYRNVLTNIEYDYWHDIGIQDVVQYLMPYELTHKKSKTGDEINEIRMANFYMEKAIRYAIEYGGLDLESFEEDEDFVEYMKERYETRALEEFRGED